MNKKLIYHTIDPFLFAQVKLILSAEEIPFQERITMDQMFHDFGTYELYVSSNLEDEAKKRINDAFK